MVYSQEDSDFVYTLLRGQWLQLSEKVAVGINQNHTDTASSQVCSFFGFVTVLTHIS